MCHRREHVHFRERQSRLTDPLRLGRNGGAQLGKQLALDLDYLLLRVEDLDLILFQFGRRETLRSDQRLFPFIVLRNQVQVRLRDLNVVAKDGIEFDLQRRDAGSPSFPLLNLRKNLFAVARKLAHFIQVAVHACRDHATVGKTQRRLRHECFLDPIA